MSDKNMAVSITVRLRDMVTGPIDRVIGRIRTLGSLGGSIGGIARSIGDLATRIGAIGAVGAGLSFVAPIQAAAKYDAALRDLAITSGTTSAQIRADVAGLAKEYEALAFRVGQRSMVLAGAANVLIAANAERASVARLMPQIGRATTAAGADAADMSKTTVALTQNLKIAEDQIERVFAGLVVAGKEGRFELKDMARAFPILTGHMANLSVTGQEAVAHLGAALQIAMRGAAEPMQAATNLENFLSKILSKETIKNFEEKGIDIKGVLEDAVLKGINPIEAALKKILGLTGMTTAQIDELQKRARAGGITDPEEIKRISELIRSIRGAGEIAEMFGDMQVKNFLIPMLAGVEDFKAIKEKIVAAMAADPNTSVLADDFKSRMEGLTTKLEMFAEVAEQSLRRVGNAFATNLGPINALLQQVIGVVAMMDAKLPGVVDTTLAWGGALLIGAAGLGVLGQAIAFVSAGLAVVAGLIGWPVLLAAGIAAAAVAVYEYWEPIKGFFTDLWGSIETTFAAFSERMKAWWDGLIPDWARPLIRGAVAAIPGAGLLQAADTAAKIAGPGPSPQKQEVGGKIVVQVDGPGRVTSVTSDSRNVPIEADRGQMLLVP